MRFNKDIIVNRITTALEASGEYDSKAAFDVSFHMTDWIEDLENLLEFYKDPNTQNDQQVEELLADFLVHAPNHLAAAKKILLGFGVSDVFEVGAVLTDEVEDEGSQR